MNPGEEARANRAGNYKIKRAAGFACEGCGHPDQTLAVDIPSEDRRACLCERCIPDRRTHKVRPGQWDEAAKLSAEAKRRAA